MSEHPYASRLSAARDAIEALQVHLAEVTREREDARERLAAAMSDASETGRLRRALEWAVARINEDNGYSGEEAWTVQGALDLADELVGEGS